LRLILTDAEGAHDVGDRDVGDRHPRRQRHARQERRHSNEQTVSAAEPRCARASGQGCQFLPPPA
jgi:hypothetical protein